MVNPLAALRGRRKPDNPDGSMSLMEHLFELRRRVTIAALAIALGGVIGFLWFNNGIFGVPSLGSILTEPYCSLPNDRRANLNGDLDSCALLATGVFDPFFLQLKAGVTAGVVFSSPVWLWQLWGFITPGLYAKEKKFARIFVGAAAALFVCGAVLAYFVVAQGLQVLLGFSSQVVTVALSPNDYFGFIIALLIIFGVSFELPLVVVMLNQVGILSAANLRKWRRGIIMGLFLFAAFATPGSDPISMVALAIALTILFELAGVIAAAHDKRKARAEASLESASYGELDDDEASPLNLEAPGPAVAQQDGVTRYTDAT